MAWRILMHAFKMIFSNWQEAIKLSFVPFASVVALSIALVFLLEPTPNTTPSVFNGVIGIIAVLVMIACYAWIAVNWHRFVLLEEYPNAIPRFPTQTVLGYIWQSIKISVPLILGVLSVLIVVQLLSFMLPMVVSIAFSVLILFIAGIFTMRLGITLPAASVGQKLTLREALQKTDHLNGAIIGVIFLMLAVNVVATMIITGITIIPFIGLAIDLVVQWFMLLLGASLLTTIYGIAVEGRELRD